MASRVTRKKQNWEKIDEALKIADLESVAVGFPAGKGLNAPHYADGKSIIEVAIDNNYGLAERNIPRRPFMEISVPNIKKVIAKAVDTKGLTFSTSAKAKRFLELIGKQSANEIKKTIGSNLPPPNSKETIRNKRSSKTLIDTGAMRQSVTYAVRKKKK